MNKDNAGTNIGRDPVIDVAKGIGILLVIFAHLNYKQPGLTIIYSFHMPLFFFLSGLVFNPNRYSSFCDFFRSRLKRLFCPYVLICFVSLLIYSAKLILECNGNYMQVFRQFMRLFFQIFIAQSSHTMEMNNPMWFIPCLLLTEVLYYFLFKVRPKCVKWILVALLVFAGWYTEKPDLFFDFSVLPWNFSTACFAMGFYCIGNEVAPLLLKKSGNSVSKFSIRRKLLSAVILAVSIALLIPLALWNGKVTLGSRILKNCFLLYLTGLLGTLTVYLLAEFLCRCRFLLYLGKNSFLIMASHKIVQLTLINIFSFICQRTTGKEFTYNALSWSHSLVMFCIVLTLSILFAVCYTRFIRPFFTEMEKKHGRIT